MVVWNVEGYLTMYLIPIETVSVKLKRKDEVSELTTLDYRHQVWPGGKLGPVFGGILSVVWWRSDTSQ